MELTQVSLVQIMNVPDFSNSLFCLNLGLFNANAVFWNLSPSVFALLVVLTYSSGFSISKECRISVVSVKHTSQACCDLSGVTTGVKAEGMLRMYR